MSITSKFTPFIGYSVPVVGAAGTIPKPPRTKNSRAAPFSLRLSVEERARLEDEAKGQPLGAYIKAKLTGAPLRTRTSGIALKDRQALAQALALLGRVTAANHLEELANAARIGALPITLETEIELQHALDEVRELRRLIIAALGLKPEDTP